MRPPVSGRTRLAAVIGDPVRHSLSPVIFDAAAAATGADLAYVALEVRAEDLREAVEGCRALGLVGMNVTSPHKERAAGFLDALSDLARRLGAVNCVTLDGTRLVGDSTDGAGFIAALRHDQVDHVGRRVAVVGAGGAARSIIAALAEAGTGLITVHNRTPSKVGPAVDLAGLRGRPGGEDDLRAADVIVQATSVGMGDDRAIPLDPDLLHAGQTVIDIVYHPIETPLLAAAAARGARTLNGLGMLVGQAAIAFERWTGLLAPVEEMRRAALHHLTRG